MKTVNLATKPVSGVLKAEQYTDYIKAKKVIEDTVRLREQAGEVIQEAERRGYQKGWEKAKQELAEQMVGAVTNTVNYLSTVEKDVAELVLISVKKILSEFDDEVLVLDAVRRGLALLRKKQRLLIRVGPQMATSLKERLPQFVDDMELIDIISDDRLGNKDCLLESDIGIVDANIDRQLAVIQRAFSDKLGIQLVEV